MAGGEQQALIQQTPKMQQWQGGSIPNYPLILLPPKSLRKTLQRLQQRWQLKPKPLLVQSLTSQSRKVMRWIVDSRLIQLYLQSS